MKRSLLTFALFACSALPPTAAVAACCETDSMKPFLPRRPIPESLRNECRGFDSAPSVVVSPGGRVWVAWHSGGSTEGEDNAVLVATSGDDGKTWSGPIFALDAEGPLRALDPGLWLDPSGKVWLFYAQVYSFWDGRGGVWAMHPDDPERADANWSVPRRLCDGFLKNKPTVLRDGRWLLPVEFMNIGPTVGRLGKMSPMTGPEAHPMPEMMAADVFESRDRGRTATFLGKAEISKADRNCTENMVFEKKDGTLVQYVRIRSGIGESFSKDGGRTWTKVSPSKIRNPRSRFFVGRIRSGALLLVKNGPIDKRTDRQSITAYVSDDDGETWKGGLVLDPRRDVSYPDVAEDARGRIHIVHDHERTRAREIVHHVVTEADVRAGKLVTSDSRLRDVITAAPAVAEPTGPTRIVFDTDMYTDFDDAGALALLHSLADAGECELLGTMVSTSGGPSAGMVEIINRFYGRGNLPIGGPKGMGMGLGHDRIEDPTRNKSYRLYEGMVKAAQPPVKFPDSASVPDANDVYRRILSAQPDGSVTIVSVGFTTNLRRLLQTSPDEISPLGGRDLVMKKVRAWYAMACRHPGGREYNARADPESTRLAFRDWPTPVYFLEYNYGKDVFCGVPAARQADGIDPVKEIFKRALVEYGEENRGHPSWDELATLAGVRGYGRYFNVKRGRFAVIDKNGITRWTDDPEGDHYILTEKTPKAEMARVVDELIARGPCKTNQIKETTK